MEATMSDENLPKKLKPANGNWVDGDRFWDRRAEVELLEEKIRDGAHVLLVAQRRMGKTSLMREVMRWMQDERRCLFIDLQKAASPQDVVAELGMATFPYQSLWDQTKTVFKNALGKATSSIEEVSAGEIGIKLRGGVEATNWMEKGDRLFDVLAEADSPVVLFVDELPIFVNNLLKGDDFTISSARRALADKFMSWLRSNALKKKGQVSMVFAGSIGLEPVLRQASLSATLTSFDPFDLGPWSQSTAADCILALAAEKRLLLAPETAVLMAERLDYCVPHHVQMFFTAAYDTCRRSGRDRFDVDQVDDVYEKSMLSVRGHAELTHYEERLQWVLGVELYSSALDMLTEAAVNGALTRESLRAFRGEYATGERDAAADQRHLLWVLEHDGYLVRSGDTFMFQSRLLKDWWRARHAFAFTPILERV
jgi:uncharacterized protein